ncbi:MAG: SDR family NAD(P)-dependent oxidoreductase [Chloroflexi bacterium]|nr:SDR family NAD(P)-dependent oxidoreductase [Chloroflexota bacterium]OJV91296.1 MAG: hypothetical protein BGO39_26995 [Chloroflexi bacterium 54-19]
MPDLRNKVAVVTGASRGVGKGVALGLGEAGATVYVTGRTTEEGQGATDLPGTIFQTAAEVTSQGGQGIALPCDHRQDEQVTTAFEKILSEQPAIDILVNNVWGGYERMAVDGKFTWPDPFWKQPLWRWDAMFGAGVRANYVASQLAAPSMIEQRRGVIVNISFWAAQKYMGNVAYGVAKAAVDKQAEYMAHELRDYNVAVVSLYPGLVATEGVLREAEWFDMSNSESPRFIGRVVAALTTDPNLMEKSGKVFVAAQLALDYGLTDVDGKQPRPLTLAEA